MEENTVRFQNLFEIDQLRCFVAAAEQHSFKQAAALLQISQPLVSRQIAELERQLGKPLFVRGHQGAELTLEGTVLLEKAQVILAHVSGMAASVQQAQLNGAVNSRLRIAVEPLFDSSMVAQSVFHFRTQSPETEIDLRILRMAEILHDLLDGSVDIGMCVLPLGKLDEQLDYRVLAREELCFVVSDQLAHVGEEGRLSWVAECLPCCLLERDYRGTNAAVQICMAMEVSPHFLFFDDIESILLQVESGTGFSVLPSRVVAAFSQKRIVAIPLEKHETSHLLLAALWRPKDAGAPVERYLRSILADCPPEIRALRQESFVGREGGRKKKTMVLM